MAKLSTFCEERLSFGISPALILTILASLTWSFASHASSVQIGSSNRGRIDAASRPLNPVAAVPDASGSPAVPTITRIDGNPIAIDRGDGTAASPAHIYPGIEVVLGGSGFDAIHGVEIDLACACPAGKLRPLFLSPGDPRLTSDEIVFDVPGGAAGAQLAGPGTLIVRNRGGHRKQGNPVTVTIGDRISVTAVTQSGSTIIVSGAGFTPQTIIKFRNSLDGRFVELGGLDPGGKANIPITYVGPNLLSFEVPDGAVAGPTYVEALNPPFAAYSSSKGAPGEEFYLRAIGTSTSNLRQYKFPKLRDDVWNDRPAGVCIPPYISLTNSLFVGK